MGDLFRLDFLLPDPAAPSTVMMLVSLLFLAATYVGYPAYIILLSKLLQRRRGPPNIVWPSVTCIITSHNGGQALIRKTLRILRLNYPKHLLRLIIADDGSTDGALSLVRKIDPERVTILESPTRQGKAAVLVNAVKAAQSEVLVFFDVRQRLERNCIRFLVTELAAKDVGAVSGRLVLNSARGAGAYWRYETAIRMAEAKLGSAVGVTGAIYAIKRSLFPLELPPNTVLDDVYIPMRVMLAGYRVAYAKGAIAYDSVFDVEKEFERKVRTLAGNYQLLAMLPAILLPWRNPVFFEFAFHKLARLVCPYAILAAAVGSGMAPGFLPLTIFVGLAGIFGLALSGLLRGERGGKLESLCCAFIALNLAAVVALYRYLSGPTKSAWSPSRAAPAVSASAGPGREQRPRA